mgnify:CR=1 FL=1
MHLAPYRRPLSASVALLVAAIACGGCIPPRFSGSTPSPSTEISRMRNIPSEQKREFTRQLRNATGAQEAAILEKARALNDMVGTQLVASSPSTIRQQRFKLGSGGSVVVVAGDERAMKVTTPMDLALAELLLERQSAQGERPTETGGEN